MRISMRAGEKIYINGAVFSVDRKVSIELLNDVTFLLEAHVMQSADANTPLRQIYFAVQLMLMDPASAPALRRSLDQMIDTFLAVAVKHDLMVRVLGVRDLVDAGRMFEALKTLRALFPAELEAGAVPAPPRNHAHEEGSTPCRFQS